METQKRKLSFLEPNVPIPPQEKRKIGCSPRTRKLKENNTSDEIKRLYSNGFEILSSRCTDNVPGKYVELGITSTILLSDQWDILMEYHEDILKEELRLETRVKISKSNFCRGEVSLDDRELAVDDLISLTMKMKCGNEVLHLAVTILDLVLDQLAVSRGNLEAMAAAAFALSYKYHKGKLNVNKIIDYYKFLKLDDLLLRERTIFNLLQHNLTFTQTTTFLHWNLYRIFGMEVPSIYWYACHYLLELMLLGVEFIEENKSVQATAAVFAALHLFSVPYPPNPDLLVTDKEIIEKHKEKLFQILRSVNGSVPFQTQSHLYRKYKSSKRCRVSAHPKMNPDFSDG